MRKHWFRSTPDLDARIRGRFEAVWRQAAGGELAYMASEEAFTG
jgi:uncharacterized protein (DUF924 family)